MSVEIRPAVVGDLPAMMVLVRELAEYERLSHAVIATEASFEAALFGERPTAEALVALVDALADELDGYHLFHATRADLLRRLGRVEKARAAYDRAIDLAGNTAETAYLTRRRDELG